MPRLTTALVSKQISFISIIRESPLKQLKTLLGACEDFDGGKLNGILSYGIVIDFSTGLDSNANPIWKLAVLAGFFAPGISSTRMGLTAALTVTLASLNFVTLGNYQDS